MPHTDTINNRKKMNAKQWAITGLVAGSVTDITTTIVGMEVYGLSEFNAVARTLMDSYGYAGMLPLTVLMFAVVLGGAWVMERTNQYGRQGAVVAISLVAMGKIGVSAWNVLLMATTL